MSRARSLAAAAAVTLVLAVTLPPVAGGGTESLPFTCIACGYRWAAGFVLNVLLFVPLGAAVARPHRGASGVARAVIAGLALSLLVEAVQVGIPGRHPALGDLLANTMGGAVGACLAVTSLAWLGTSGRPRRGVTAAWGAAVVAVVLGTSWMLTPFLPRSTWWVQHVPALGQFDTFPGTVVNARAGDLPLPAGRLPVEDRDRLRRGMLRRPELTAEAMFGRPTEGLAPVVSVFDDRQREILVLGQDGEDLVFRLRRRADAVGLERPEHRAPGLLAGVGSGDTVRLGAVPSDPDDREGTVAADAALCLTAGRSARCDLGFRPGRGWRLLLDPGLAPRAIRWVDGAWVALLFLPLGFWANPGREWRGAAVAASGALLLAPAVGPVLAPGIAEVTGLVAGLSLGRMVRGLLGRYRARG